MLRRFFFWSHLLVGLVSGFVLTVSALTGLVLAVLPLLIEGSERTVPESFAPTAAHTLTVDQAVGLVAKAYPGFEAGAVTFSADPERPLVVAKARRRAGASTLETVPAEIGNYGVVWVSLSNGHVAPAPGNAFRNANKWLETVHRWFGVSSKPWKEGLGHLVAACSFGLIFAVGSGLFLWGPFRWWKRSAKAKVPRGARGWHESLGTLFSPWLLLAAFTGAVMFYDWAGDLVFKGLGKGADLSRFAVPTAGAPLKTRESQLRHVLAMLPEAETLTLLPPDAKRGPTGEQANQTGVEVVVSVVEKGSHSPVPTWVRFNGTSGALNRVDIWAEMPWRQALRQAAKPLHTGQALGFAGAVLGVLTSVVLLVLCFSGWWLAWKRFARTKPGS